MRFWLDLGVDGLRLDAIPYLCVRDGTSNENLPETHAVVKQIRAALDASYPNRMLLAEANQWPEDVREYFGNGDECHMAYHFPLMPRMYMAIAQEDRYPIVEIMQQTPDIPPTCQWAIFLRNHDELTLEMVTDRERDYMYQMYAADPRARVNVGIRRRLAPLMENDPADPAHEQPAVVDARLADRLLRRRARHGRQHLSSATATACARRCSGAPTATAASRAPIRSACTCRRSWIRSTATQSVNVEAQAREPSSLLNWTRRMLAVRKTSHAFGRGTFELPAAGQPQDPRLSARDRRRGDPLRREPEALGAAGRARPRALSRPRAGRAARAARRSRRSASCPTC